MLQKEQNNPFKPFHMKVDPIQLSQAQKDEQEKQKKERHAQVKKEIDATLDKHNTEIKVQLQYTKEAIYPAIFLADKELINKEK